MMIQPTRMLLIKLRTDLTQLFLVTILVKPVVILIHQHASHVLKVYTILNSYRRIIEDFQHVLTSALQATHSISSLIRRFVYPVIEHAQHVNLVVRLSRKLTV
jgi:hypothetical protein